MAEGDTPTKRNYPIKPPPWKKITTSTGIKVEIMEGWPPDPYFAYDSWHGPEPPEPAEEPPKEELLEKKLLERK